MSTIVVTGGAGFIGSHIVDRLLEKGHKVHVLDNLSSGVKSNLSPQATLHEIDIRSREIRDLLRSINPEAIVHTAAQISVRISMEDPTLDTDINLVGLVNILQSFQGRSHPFFVMISTGGAIYGEQDVFPADEDHPIRPNSVYGLAKRASELYLDLWKREMKQSFCALRLANVYGPRQNPHGEAGVVAIFLQKLLRGEVPMINGSGDQTRDFVYVRDVSLAVLKAVESKTEGTYNIGTGRETSVNQLYTMIAKALGTETKAIHGPAKAGEQMRSCIDAGRALKSLGWNPSVSLEDGCRETAAWFREQHSK